LEISNQIPTQILNHLINDETYCRRVIPFLKKEYFDQEHKVVFDLIVSFVNQHNKIPSGKVLDLELKKVNAPEDVLNRTQTLINELKEKSDIDIDYLINESEKWCKDRAVYNAIMDSIQIIDGKDSERGDGAIPEILSNALGVSFDPNIAMTILIIQMNVLNFIIQSKLEFHLIWIILIKLQKAVYQIKHSISQWLVLV